MSPGSMPVAREIYQEGLILPPIRLARRGEILPDVHGAAARQRADAGGARGRSHRPDRGQSRGRDSAAQDGRAVRARPRRSRTRPRSRTTPRASSAPPSGRCPNGRYEFEDALDDDGFADTPVRIRAAITIAGDRATVDFTGSDPQVEGSVNANYAMTLSACLYVFRCLVADDVLYNAGVGRPLTRHRAAGDDRQCAAAVGGGRRQRRDLAADHRRRVRRAGEGGAGPHAGRQSGHDEQRHDGRRRSATGQRLRLLRDDRRRAWAARRGLPGLSGVHTHMSNTRNTPSRRSSAIFRCGSASTRCARTAPGSGAYPGGEGIVREYEMLTDTSVTVLSERRRRAPYGAPAAARAASAATRSSATARREALPGKIELQLRAGRSPPHRNTRGRGVRRIGR